MHSSQAEVAALLAAEKVLSANIRWRAVGHERYRLEAKVLVPITGVLLTLAGNKGKRNFSFRVALRQLRDLQGYKTLQTP